MGASAFPLPDYHTHSARCGHAGGTPAEYVEEALRKGLPAVGLSDHLPQIFDLDPESAMTPDELAEYVDEVLELKQLHPGRVLLGIEADYRPDTIEGVRELVLRFPFDYVIGSVHHVEGWAFDDARYMSEWDKRDVDEVYRRYFLLVGESAESGVFTTLGHVDLVKKFGHRPHGSVQDAVEEMAARIAGTDVLVEVNTAGLRRPAAEIYPHLAILRSLRERGVRITFGSDAHKPSEVGSDFDRAAALALAAGYTEYAAFETDGAPAVGVPGAVATTPAASRARIRMRALPAPRASARTSPAGAPETAW
jgi:histidinol-phosphatase (PHP family)